MRRTAVALCALLLLTLAACTSGGESSDAPEGGTAQSEVAAPDRPADERTEEGAIAFAAHVFDVLQYSYLASDPSPLEDIADLELCFGCMQPLEAIAAASSSGEELEGGSEVSTSDAQIVDETGARTTVRLQVQQDGLTSSGPTASVPASDAPMLVTLRWDATRWTLVNFAPVGN